MKASAAPLLRVLHRLVDGKLEEHLVVKAGLHEHPVVAEVLHLLGHRHGDQLSRLPLAQAEGDVAGNSLDAVIRKLYVVGLPFEYPTVVVPGSRQGRPKKDDVRPKEVDVRSSA